MDTPVVESSSSNTLLYVLIAVGVVVVLALIGLGIWLSKRSSRPGPAAAGWQGAPSTPSPMAPGWYADPHGQARLRWYDGAQWTAQTQV